MISLQPIRRRVSDLVVPEAKGQGQRSERLSWRLAVLVIGSLALLSWGLIMGVLIRFFG